MIAVLFPVSCAYADWNSGKTIEASATRLTVNVLNNGVKAELTVHADVIGASQLNKENFARRILAIQTDHPIPATVSVSAENEQASVMTLWFAFTRAQPERIALKPDFDLLTLAGQSHQISVAHLGLPVIDHDVLTQAETLSLDWQDPWQTHFENPELKRDHGDPVMAFLYIEQQQIKAEIVVRVKELTEWLDLGLADQTWIAESEFEHIRQKTGDFLASQNPLKVDGMLRSPVLDKVDFIRMGAEDIQAYQPQQTQLQTTTLIGVSLHYEISDIPAKLAWQWDLYTDSVQRVVIRAYDSAGLFDSYVTHDYRVFEWENMLADIDLPELTGQKKAALVAVENDNEQRINTLRILLVFLMAAFVLTIVTSEKMHLCAMALLILLLGGSYVSWAKAGKPDVFAGSILAQDNTTGVVEQLLWNIYQAFESTDESETYDKLAYSVQGDLIETLYLQNRQAFLMEDGAWSRVENIQIKQISEVSDVLEKGKTLDCQWLVTGQVVHWGHQHQRENLYRARINIQDQEGFWKITALESLGQERVDEAESM